MAKELHAVCGFFGRMGPRWRSELGIDAGVHPSTLSVWVASDASVDNFSNGQGSGDYSKPTKARLGVNSGTNEKPAELGATFR